MTIKALDTIFGVQSLIFYSNSQEEFIMRRNINNSKLTKNSILSKVSQINIFSAYTGIEPEIIQHCIDTGKFICSPFREDKHPSFGFRYEKFIYIASFL